MRRLPDRSLRPKSWQEDSKSTLLPTDLAERSAFRDFASLPTYSPFSMGPEPTGLYSTRTPLLNFQRMLKLRRDFKS
jgi:hypothetical protein